MYPSVKKNNLSQGFEQYFLVASLFFGLFVFGRIFSKKYFFDSSFLTADSIILRLISTAWEYSPLVTLASLIILTTTTAYLALTAKWSDIASQPLRLFLLIVIAIVVWRNSTYEYNYIYDSAYHFDRLAIILLGLLCIWRPVFVLYVSLVTFIIQNQFLMPGVDSYSTAQVSMPIKIIFAFSMYFLYSHFISRKPEQLLIWTIAIIILAHYWVPAYQKYTIDWFKHGQIHNMMAASYAGGWLGFVSNSGMSSFIATLSKLNPLLMIITLIFETAVIIALLNRKLLIFLLFVAIVFHILVFVQSGICFWQWALIDAAFIHLLLRNKQSLPDNKILLLLSFVLIGSSHLWSGAARLGWHDVPVSYNYFVDVTSESGEKIILPPSYFAPYEYSFSLGHLRHLSNESLPPISWGATHDLEFASSLSNAKTKQDVMSLLLERSVPVFDSSNAEKTDAFLTNYLQTKQLRSKTPFWFDYFSAPLYIYTGSSNRHPVDITIKRIEVRQRVSWFNGTELTILQDNVIRKIDI